MAIEMRRNPMPAIGKFTRRIATRSRTRTTSRLILAIAAMALTTLIHPLEAQAAPAFTSSFMFDTCQGFSSQGRNPFFILVPGFQLVLAGQEDEIGRAHV